jgi:hypothetical protein
MIAFGDTDLASFKWTHNVLHRAGYHVPRAEDAPVPNSEDINQRRTRPSRRQGE